MIRTTRLTQIGASDRADAADTHSGRDEGTDRADGGGEIPRLASTADLPAIRRVIADAYSRYLDRMNKPPAPMVTDYGPAIARGQVWVLGEPVIGVIVLTEEADSLLVENVAVSPAAQGAGNGRRLLEFAERQAILAGLRRLTLYTNEVMAENIALYARLGYRETGRRSEDGYRRVFMAKLLPPKAGGKGPGGRALAGLRPAGMGSAAPPTAVQEVAGTGTAGRTNP